MNYLELPLKCDEVVVLRFSKLINCILVQNTKHLWIFTEIYVSRFQ